MKITRALISVSDKKGDRCVRSRAGKAGRRYHFHRRNGGTVAKGKRSGARHFELHRFSGSAGGPGQDAASASAWRFALQTRQSETRSSRRGNAGFQPIDLVVVNLYPFEATIAKAGRHARGSDRADRHRRAVDDPQRGEELRIGHGGGRSGRLRAVLEDMRDHDGETTLKLRERLAIKAFIKTSDYDRAIANFLNQEQDDRRFVFTLAAAGYAFALRRKSASDRRALRRFRSSISKNCTAKSFPLTTFSTSARPPI